MFRSVFTTIMFQELLTFSLHHFKHMSVNIVYMSVNIVYIAVNIFHFLCTVCCCLKSLKVLHQEEHLHFSPHVSYERPCFILKEWTTIISFHQWSFAKCTEPLSINNFSLSRQLNSTGSHFAICRRVNKRSGWLLKKFTSISTNQPSPMMQNNDGQNSTIPCSVQKMPGTKTLQKTISAEKNSFIHSFKLNQGFDTDLDGKVA